jgi:hypothetical protein
LFRQLVTVSSQKWKLLLCSFSLILEAPPDYHFTKKLVKKHSTYPHEELVLRCTLNTYKALVKWYKDGEELSGDDRYFDDKDIMGVCSLKIIDPTKEDAGKFSCKIVGRIRKEKDKTYHTKTEVIVKGTASIDKTVPQHDIKHEAHTHIIFVHIYYVP